MELTDQARPLDDVRGRLGQMGQGGSGAQDKELPAESHQKLPNKYVRQESVEGGTGRGGRRQTQVPICSALPGAHSQGQGGLQVPARKRPALWSGQV